MTSNQTNTRLTYQWYVVILLMLAQMLSFIDRMILGLLVKPVREAFNISDTQFSLLAGFAFALFYAVMGLPLARIADRYSRKLLICGGIAVWSVMTALCGLANSYRALFLARMGVGVGEASLSPAAYSMISDMFPRHLLGRAFSLYTFGVAIGSGLAYVIGGRVIAWLSGLGQITLPLVGEVEAWQATFMIVGIPGFVLALVFLLSVREPERADKSSVVQAAVPVAEVVRFVLARWQAILVHVAGMALFIMVVFSLNIWGPEYFIRTFGYSAPQAGVTMGILLTAGAGGGLLAGGYFGDRLFSQGKKDAYSRVIMGSMLGLLPFTLALGFDLSAGLATACLFMALFFSGFQGGIAGGLLQLMTPNEMRGQVVAIYFLLANLIGLGFGPTAVAVTTDFVFGDDAALGKSIALCALVLVPLAFGLLFYSLKHVRQAITDFEAQVAQ